VTLEQKAARIKLLVFDVDGVLTDGQVLIHADGTESKSFAIRDGIAMVWAQRVGLKIAWLSARSSATTPHRAAQLGVAIIHQGVKSKAAVYTRLLATEGLTDADVAFMGDDIVDLAVLARAGLSAAPADAADDVRRRVDWVSAYGGGRGAARELIELVLRAQHRWNGLVDSYRDEPTGDPASPGAAAGARRRTPRGGRS
jgi:3-deoxy-D-manno-octulosonate 8-phosphate phosphatase (KDO 8-P phosphatase)